MKKVCIMYVIHILWIMLSEAISKDLNIILLHNGDILARYEEVGSSALPCNEHLKRRNLCFGGISRTFHVIKEHRRLQSENKMSNVIYLFAGSAWGYVYQENISAAFMNLLNPEALSLGYHEFDKGVAALNRYTGKVTCPIVTSNLNVKYERSVRIYASVVIGIEDKQIGIIGHVTTQTGLISRPGKLIIEDELSNVRRECQRLRILGVNIIIVIGCSGIKVDKAIAKKIPDVDVVVGTMDKVFLYNGEPPMREKKVDGPYPLIVKQPSGKEVPVVHAYAFTYFLGRLNLQFNDKGDIIHYEGQPIYLSQSVPEDEESLKLLDVFRPKVDEFRNAYAGRTTTILEGNNDVCYRRECNYGNLIADAFAAYATHYLSKPPGSWTSCPIGMIHAGTLKIGLDVRWRKGNITRGDLLITQPYGNPVYVCSILGQYLLQTLEIAVRNNGTGETTRGEFLHLSGMRVIFNMRNPQGERVIEATVLCSKCDIPQYEPVHPEAWYNISLPDFILLGHEGHTVLRQKCNNPVLLDKSDVNTLMWYILKNSPIAPENRERVVILQKNEDFNLILLHNGDMLARYEEIGPRGLPCNANLKAYQLCFAGMSRTFRVIKEYRKLQRENKISNVIYLFAGNIMTGSAWGYVYQENISIAFMNLFRPEALCLGFHEFDKGVPALKRYTDGVESPIVTSNVDLRYERSIRKIVHSTIIKVADQKIGIVGHVTTQTRLISRPGNVIIEDEFSHVKTECRRLHTQGIKIIIVLGCSGIKIDKAIAKKIPEVDLVVGAMDKLLLYNGRPPIREKKVYGPYPLIVKQSSGKRVPIVHAYAFTYFLGCLNLTFNEKGDIIYYDGQPIFLWNTVPEDEESLQLLNKFRPKVDAFRNTYAGQTTTILEGNNEVCYHRECNYGNLIADAFAAYATHQLSKPPGSWTSCPIGMIHAGTLKVGLDVRWRFGNITRGDLLITQPYGNPIFVCSILGQYLLQTLEIAVRNNGTGDTTRGEFLHLSGMQVVINMQNQQGHRVVKASVLCSRCDIPQYEPIHPEEWYNISLPDFILLGHEGHTVLRQKCINPVLLDKNDVDLLMWYIRKNSPVAPEIQDRVVLLESSGSCSITFSIYLLVYPIIYSIV